MPSHPQPETTPQQGQAHHRPTRLGITSNSAQNHKGEVTKTTSTANLGAMLAEAGRLVLIVDCDPQANLSEAFGWGEELPGERLEDLLTNPIAAERYAPPEALQPDVALGLWWRARLRIIPSTDALADVAADLPATAGHELRLREVLEPLRDRFDVVLLDAARAGDADASARPSMRSVEQ